MFRKLSFILFLVFCFSFANLVAQEITLAYVTFPPYEYIENGKPAGILVEVVEKIFDEAGIKLNLVHLPFKRATMSVENGTIDGLFNFYMTPERLKKFDYSEQLISNPLVFFVKKESKFEYEKLSDLNGMKIGVMRGYSYGNDFDSSSIFAKDVADSHESNFSKLEMERIDAYLCERLVGVHNARKSNIMDELRIVNTPLKIMKGYIGFTKGKHRDSIDKINKVIRKMHENNEIEKMIEDYVQE